jgi:hypothetical protein
VGVYRHDQFANQSQPYDDMVFLMIVETTSP